MTAAGAPHSEGRAAALAGVGAFAALVLLPDLGALAQFTRAEIYFAEVAREMLATGDGLTPRFCGEVFFDKPPLVYWLIAASFWLFGATEAAARLPSALGSVATVLLTAAFAMRHYGRAAGIVSGLALATSIGFWSFARYAMSDALLTLFVAGALFAYREALARERWKPYVLAGHCSLGLALLTKGPVALVLVGLTLAAAFFLIREAPWRRLLFAPALALFFAVTLPWYVAVVAEHGRFFVDYFLLGENVSRFLGESYTNPKPPGFYLLVLLTQFFPWSLWVLPAVVVLLKGEPAPPMRATTRFLLAWSASTLAFFSVSGFQLDYYVLPAYPALAGLVGGGLAPLMASRDRMRWTVIALVLATAALFGGLAYAFWKSALLLFPDRSFLSQAALPALLGAGALVLLAASRRRSVLPGTLAATTGLTLLLLNPLFVRPYSVYQSIPRFGRAIAERLGERPARPPLGLAFDLAAWHPDLRFYTGIAAEPLRDAPSLMRFLNGRRPALLIAPERHVRFFSGHRSFRIRELERGLYAGHSIPGLDAFRRPWRPETIVLVEVLDRRRRARTPPSNGSRSR